MIIAIPIGNNGLLHYQFVKSLLACKDYPHMFAVGLYIEDNRNSAYRLTRDQDLLMIDSDMTFTLEDVRKMEENLKDRDIVTGLYRMGIDGAPWAIFKDDHPTEPEDKMFEIDACGAGFLGISLRVLLDEPFTRVFNKKSGMWRGEDMSFCQTAKEKGYKIHCDPEIKLGHIKTKII